MYIILVEIAEGRGEGITFVFKNWRFRGRGEGGWAYVKFPLWWGYGYFLEPHKGNVKFTLESKNMAGGFASST